MNGLYVFAARDKPVCVILASGHRRTKNRLILWDVMTDTFIRGQWLKSNCKIDIKFCGVSPDGAYFVWRNEMNTHSDIGVSTPPYFTAEHFFTQGCGGWSHSPYFSVDGKLVYDDREPPDRCSIEYVRSGVEYDSLVLSAAKTHHNVKVWTPNQPYGSNRKQWVDFRGRTITADCGKIFADGVLLEDFTNDTFESIVVGDIVVNDLGSKSADKQ